MNVLSQIAATLTAGLIAIGVVSILGFLFVVAVKKTWEKFL